MCCVAVQPLSCPTMSLQRRSGTNNNKTSSGCLFFDTTHTVFARVCVCLCLCLCVCVCVCVCRCPKAPSPICCWPPATMSKKLSVQNRLHTTTFFRLICRHSVLWRAKALSHTHTRTHTHTHTPVCAFVYGCSWSLQAGRCACLQRVRTIVRNGSSCCSNASQRGKQPKLAVSLRAPSPFCPPPLTSDSLCLILDAVVVLPGSSIVLLTHLLLLWPWQSF